MTNWIIIGAVIAAAIGLVVYLVRQNKKDKDDYTNFLNKQDALKEEEDELSDER